MSEALKDFTSVLLAIIAVAIVGVLVSKNANTSGVVNSGSSAFNTALATAAGPVTGYSPGPPIYANQNTNLFGELGAGFNASALG